MRWVTEERGAAAVLTAVSLTALIAMAAFAIDTGALYAERRELQNGADAAALAIAEDCAYEILPCTGAFAQITGDAYADANASDSAALIHDIALDPTGKTVTVTVRSEDEAGETVMAPFFAQVIGFDGTEVQAAATAEWGFPRGIRQAPPLIISDCEYNPGYIPPTWPEKGDPFIFYFHDGNSPDFNEEEGSCHESTSGFDLPGGFGWLAASGCGIDLDTGTDHLADPGSSPSNGCTPEVLKKRLMPHHESKQVATVLPYFSQCVAGDGDCMLGLGGLGNNIWYTVSDFGGFFVTGYNFGGQYKQQTEELFYPDGEPFLPAGLPCTGDERCIAGYFAEATIYDGTPGGTDRGVILIKLTN